MIFLRTIEQHLDANPLLGHFHNLISGISKTVGFPTTLHGGGFFWRYV